LGTSPSVDCRFGNKIVDLGIILPGYL
jgi:hypothetical protein